MAAFAEFMVCMGIMCLLVFVFLIAAAVLIGTKNYIAKRYGIGRYYEFS